MNARYLVTLLVLVPALLLSSGCKTKHEKQMEQLQEQRAIAYQQNQAATQKAEAAKEKRIIAQTEAPIRARRQELIASVTSYLAPIIAGIVGLCWLAYWAYHAFCRREQRFETVNRDKCQTALAALEYLTPEQRAAFVDRYAGALSGPDDGKRGDVPALVLKH